LRGRRDQLVKHEYDPFSTNFIEPRWQHAEGYPRLREDW
jgi:hypothetical protein